VTTPLDSVPDNLDALKAALAAERMAREMAEARASGAEAMVVHLKLIIAKMKRDRFGQSSERSRKILDQLELQLEELEATATEDEIAAEIAVSKANQDSTVVRNFPAANRRGRRCRASASSRRDRGPARAVAGCCANSAKM
jgi:transposase